MRLALEGSDTIVTARREGRPRFSGHRGATWDSVTVHVDGQAVRLHADTTWGTRGYFTLDGTAWYAVPILKHDPFGGAMRYTTRHAAATP